MRKAFLLISVWMLIQSLPLHAQSTDENSPLLMSAVRNNRYFIEEDLYRYQDNEWQPVTTGGYKTDFTLSPDGRQMAYLAAPSPMRQAVEAGHDYIGGGVWNMMLLDLTSGQTRELTGQPSDFTITADWQVRNGVTRSQPVWSPDGSALAWTEQDYPAQNIARLVVDDLSADQILVVDDALPQMYMSEDGLPSFLAWGQRGIVVFTNDPITLQAELRFYDPSNGLIWTGSLPDEPPDWMPMSGLQWVSDGDSQNLVVRPHAMIWYQFAPDGQVSGFSRHLERVSANQPSKSLRFIWNIFAMPDQDAWTLVSPHGTTLVSWPVNADPQNLTSYAISPSGQQAAYGQGRRVFLWQNGAAAEITVPDDLKPEALFWGPMQWQAGAAYDGIG